MAVISAASYILVIILAGISRVRAEESSSPQNLPQALFARVHAEDMVVFQRLNQAEYAFYANAITQMSVPQIASVRGLSEGDVYRQLNLFRLPLLEPFQREMTAEELNRLSDALKKTDSAHLAYQLKPQLAILDQLSLLQVHNLPAEECIRIASQVFRFGSEALRFVLHHRWSRNVDWSRSALYHGQLLTEVEILALLALRGRSGAEITKVLNHLFTHSKQKRSQARIEEKIEQLRLSPVDTSRIPNLYHPDYGYLKKAGWLNPIPAYQFIYEHPDQSASFLAEQLGVDEEWLEYFKQNPLHTLKDLSSSEVSSWSKRFLNQMNALQITLNWIEDPEQGAGRLPMERDVDSRAFPFMWPRLVGSSQYKAGKARATQAIFPSTAAFYLALKEFARVRGVPVRLLEMTFQKIPPELKQELREEAMELVLQWILTHGSTPVGRNFGRGPGQIPLAYDRLTNIGHYSRQDLAESTALFESSQDFWLEMKHYAALRGVRIELLKILFVGPLLPEMRQALRQEANELIFEWMRVHKRMPVKSDFGKQKHQVPGYYARLINAASFGRGQLHSEPGIFQGPQDFWRQMKRYAQVRGFNIRLLDRSFLGGLEEATRQVLQQEALEILFDWLTRHCLPASDLKEKRVAKLLPLNFERLTATGRYRQYPEYEKRIFDSTEQLEKALNQYMRQMKQRSCTSLM